VRLHSLLGLRHLAGEEDIPRLAMLVNDPKPAVRRALTLALWRTGSPEAAPPLIELVSRREPNRNVRLFARKALAALAGGQDAGQDERAWRRLFAESLDKGE
jgi:HEAT repeat protein